MNTKRKDSWKAIVRNNLFIKHNQEVSLLLYI